MPTLYELVDALPDDDADGLRRAFRKAAKANHPDNNPDDPDAPLRFRRIVRAHAILSDDAQRATYDACLVKVQQQALPPKRRLASEFRSLLRHAVSGVLIAFVSIGAYLLIENVSRMRSAPTQEQGIPIPASAQAAAMPTQPVEPATVGRAGEHDRLDDVPPSHEPEVPDAPREMAAPVNLASADNTVAVPTDSDTGVKDARYYRERGGLAYRSGDLPLALIDFDLAIDLDPNFADAYVDRAIVFRRMGDQKRALADVAQVKRIDEFKLQQTASP